MTFVEGLEDLQPCDPSARLFPLSWKEAYFRINFNPELNGYVCPLCHKVFRGTKGFKQLKADHRYPFSKGGLTIWSNLQLLCLPCNARKNNSF